jgi:hypothetical protein
MKARHYFLGGINLFCACCFGIEFSSTTEIPTSTELVNSDASIETLVHDFINNQEYLVKTNLCRIMNSNGSDKGSGHHNYTTLYEKLFSKYQDQNITIFELGLGTNYPDVKSNMGPNGIPGASLFGWAEYFPAASVYGADIDKRVLFDTDRIRTYYCDQMNEQCIKDMFSNEDLENIEFDIIVEDGLHDFDANISFLVNSIDRLKVGGIYICEDLGKSTIDKFQQIIPDLKDQYSLAFIEVVSIPGANPFDNALLVIQK